MFKSEMGDQNNMSRTIEDESQTCFVGNDHSPKIKQQQDLLNL